MPSGAAIDVNLHWAKWLPALGLVAALTFMAAICVFPGIVLPFAVGLGGALLFAGLLPGMAALRNGFLVRINAAGVHARGRVIPWRDVQGVHVETKRLKVHRMNGSELAIPLFFARFDADALPQAVRVSAQLWKACHG